MLNKTSIQTFLTHSLSASGAVIALMALEATYQSQWETVFFWLGLALFIDAIDGPIARSVGVGERPRFSGARIDLIVDYLTYVFVPAVLFIKSAFLPVAPSMILAAIILMSSLFHFSDTRSKAQDHAFVGFPAIWNIVLFYLYVFQPSPVWTALIILGFAVLTFIPFKWTHPIRIARHRPLTLCMTAAGSAAALWVLHRGFSSPSGAAQTVLAAAALYGLILVLLNATIWRH